MKGLKRNMNQKDPSFLIHKVKKGDTLYKIGKNYQVKVSSLIFANPYADVYHLQHNDEICIPVQKRF